MKPLYKTLIFLFVVLALCVIGLLIGIAGYDDKPVNLSPIPRRTPTIRVLVVPNPQPALEGGASSDYTPTADPDH